MATKKLAQKAHTARPYTTDYGATKGHCETPKGAVTSALLHLRKSGGKHCVIERPHGPPIDIWWNGHFGITVVERKGGKVLLFKKQA